MATKIALIFAFTLASLSAMAQNWNKTNEVRTWPDEKIPEEGHNPNLDTVRHHLKLYNNRGRSWRYVSRPADKPKKLDFKLVDSPAIDQQLNETYLASYMLYEKGNVLIDKISPLSRFGDLIDNQTKLYSMSLGKSLIGYLTGHALCLGHIESLDSPISDWPVVRDSLIGQATLRDVLNATMGHQPYLTDNETLKLSGRNLNQKSIFEIASYDLADTNPGKKRFAYGQLPPNVAVNYLAFKTGLNFQEFLSEVMSNYVGLEDTLAFNHDATLEIDGPLKSNFKATRYDTLRIGIAILNDWKADNCVGRYLKDIYATRVTKGYKQGDGFSKSYGGFFHADYSGVSDTVLGMDGYGGIALLINFDDERIVYTHAAHRNYNYKKIVLRVVEDGIM